MPTDATLVGDTGLTLLFAQSDLRSIGWAGDVAIVGPWRARSSYSQWGLSEPDLPLGELRATEMSVVDGVSVTVAQVYDQAKVDYIYTVAGDRVSVEIGVTHSGKQAIPIRRPTFDGPAADFSASPQGNFNSWHPSYFPGHDVMHPSVASPLGVFFLTGDDWGLAVYTRRHFERAKLFHIRWVKDLPPLPTCCVLEYYVDDTIWPGETHRYDIQLHVRKSTDWKVLLEPYREAFRATLPPLQYDPDHRTTAYFASVDSTFIRQDNPLGINDNKTNFRRFDRVEGIQDWINRVGIPLAGCGGQGIIHWALQGHSPRGAMYRPDFDVFPPSVQANLPALTTAIAKLNLTAGLCTRPGEGVTPATSDADNTFRLAASSADQVNLLLQRFKNVTTLGFNLFYLDTFGALLDDVALMKRIRAQLGPAVQCFCEYHCDLLLPYAGRYTEWHGPGGHPFASQQFFDISRYLQPDFPILCKVLEPMNFKILGDSKLTPLIEDFQMQPWYRSLEAFGKIYFDGKKWKA